VCNPVVVRYMQAGQDDGPGQGDHAPARATGRDLSGANWLHALGQAEGDTTDTDSESDDMMLPHEVTVGGLPTRNGPALAPVVAGALRDHMLRQRGAGRDEGSAGATGSNDPMVLPMDARGDWLSRAHAEYHRIKRAVTAVLRYKFRHKFTSMEELAGALRLGCSAQRLEQFFRHECPHMGEHRFILLQEEGEWLVRAIPSVQRFPRSPDRR